MNSNENFRPGGFALFAFVVILPLGFALVLYEPFTAAKELILASGAMLLLPVWIVTSRDFHVSPLWIHLGLLVFLAGISLVHVPRYEAMVFLLAALAIFVVASSELRDASTREQLSTLITAAGAIEAVYVLWQTMVGDAFVSAGGLPGKWRAYGTFGNPNWAGEFLVVAILVTWGRLLARRSWIATICAATMTAALGATFARGAWLSLAGGAVAMWLCRKRQARELRTAALVAAAAFLAGAIFTFRSDTIPYLTGVASLRGRVWMSLASLFMIWRAPLGVGLGGYGLRFPEIQAQLYQAGWSRPFERNASFTGQAHNDYLQVIAELGLMAVPVVVLLIWRIVRRGRALTHDPIALGFWAALVSMMVNALYASPFYLPGSLGGAAVLLGAVEAASPPFRSFVIPRTARWATAAVALVLSCVTWSWCWRRGVVEYRLNQAAQAMAVDNWRQASAMLAEAARLDPARIDTYALLGRVQLAQRQFTVAAGTYAHAARLGFREEVFTGRATALWHAGQSAAALRVLEQLVRLRPDLEWSRRKLIELRAEAAREEMTP